MAERVVRKWGFYEVLHESPGYKVKVLTLNPGAAISLQTHARRSEHWVFMGHGIAEVRDHAHGIGPLGCVCIKPGDKHRAINPGNEPLRITEVQHGDYLGEDDITRYDV